MRGPPVAAGWGPFSLVPQDPRQCFRRVANLSHKHPRSTKNNRIRIVGSQMRFRKKVLDAQLRRNMKGAGQMSGPPRESAPQLRRCCRTAVVLMVVFATHR